MVYSGVFDTCIYILFNIHLFSEFLEVLGEKKNILGCALVMSSRAYCSKAIFFKPHPASERLGSVLKQTAGPVCCDFLNGQLNEPVAGCEL